MVIVGSKYATKDPDPISIVSLNCRACPLYFLHGVYFTPYFLRLANMCSIP
jgi:hypothetical protein